MVVYYQIDRHQLVIIHRWITFYPGTPAPGHEILQKCTAENLSEFHENKWILGQK